MADPIEQTNARRAYKAAQESETLFQRSEIFHQMLMEDFRFMEAARLNSGEYEGANLSTDNLKSIETKQEKTLDNLL